MSAGGARARRLAAAALVAACALAPAARAQAQARPDRVDLDGRPITGGALLAPSEPEPVHAQRPAPPLPPALALRLARARDLRAAGLPERARDTLLALARVRPHHPEIVTELARAELARADWSAAERLAKDERAAQHDSVLLGRELALAEERLGRPREALQAALEAWVAVPFEAAWALPEFLRLAPLAPHDADALLAAATARAPGRADLAIGRARMLAHLGRPADAVRALASFDHAGGRHLREQFTDDALVRGTAVDSAAAREALLDLASDATRDSTRRLEAAERAWEVAEAGGLEAEIAPRIPRALADLPRARWSPPLLVGVARALRESGREADAQALLAGSPELARRVPQVALEQALVTLREGPPARAVPALDSLAATWKGARFPLAEAQFFAGRLDSARANYTRVSADPQDPDAAAALERLYLIEEAPDSPALAALERVAWERWRHERGAARALADSLARALPPSAPYAAQARLQLANLDVEAGDVQAALAPLLLVADSLAADRLAPLARQRAGDAYLKLGDTAKALAQYEECLVRYPRAWNAAEVRRRVEKLRRERI